MPGRLGVRFRKLESELFLNEPESFLAARALDPEDGALPAGDVRRHVKLYRRCLRPYRNVAGYDGVFLCSSTPQWLMVGSRKVVRQHPLCRDWGDVVAFSEFDSVHCPRGFVALCGNGDMRIAGLAAHVNYDDSMITHKTPLKRTVTHIAYHPETGLYAIASYVREPMLRLPPFRNEEPETAEEAPMSNPRYIPATRTR